MDLALKYRIVGAAVLLSLAVIFVPMVLDGSGQKSVTKVELDMPPEPTLIFSDELEQRVQTPAPEYTRSADQSNQVTSAKPDLAKNIVPEITIDKDTKSELLSWVVQVGAFGEEDKATALQSKLAKAGFDAIIESSGTQDKMIYRVKVGPVISQDTASKLQDRLRKEFKLESAFVTRHPRAAQ